MRPGAAGSTIVCSSCIVGIRQSVWRANAVSVANAISLPFNRSTYSFIAYSHVNRLSTSRTSIALGAAADGARLLLPHQPGHGVGDRLVAVVDEAAGGQKAPDLRLDPAPARCPAVIARTSATSAPPTRPDRVRMDRASSQRTQVDHTFRRRDMMNGVDYAPRVAAATLQRECVCVVSCCLSAPWPARSSCHPRRWAARRRRRPPCSPSRRRRRPTCSR